MPTPKPATIAEALADLQQNLPHITKDATAQYGKYANLTGVSEKLLPMMGERGLSFSAKATMHDGEFGLLYRLRVAGSDEVDEGFWPLPKGTPQQVGSAITYYRRYLLCSLTGVAPDEDDDDGQAGGEAAPPQRTKAKIPGPDHAQLRHGTVERTPDDQIADRGPVPPADDLWADQPPGELAASPLAPEERPGTLDGRQRSQIMAKLGRIPREERVTKLTEITGREVESTNDLSHVEAALVIKTLTEDEKAAKAATP